MLGRALAALPEAQHTKVATKANPAGEAGDCGTGGLAAPRLAEQLGASLRALGAPTIDLFYLHWPDTATTLEETLDAVQKAYEAGRFRRFGLSNFEATEVTLIHEHMRSRGWVVPTVYQGMLNAITRDVEGELLPTLRSLNMSFYAYNPLAGGLLTGKHDFADNTTHGRFANNPWYQNRYWHAEQFAALAAAKGACDNANVSMAEAALRWLAHHSKIDAALGDAIIVGASSVSQLESNMRALTAGPLPNAIATAWDTAWDVAKSRTPAYASYGRSGEHLSHVLTAAQPVNDGEHIDLSFGSGERFRLHAGWLLDSSPEAFTESYVRRDITAVLDIGAWRATSARASDNGAELVAEFAKPGYELVQLRLCFDAAWIAVAAPYAGQSLCGAPPKTVDDTGNLLERLPKHLWRSDMEVHSFDARELVDSDEAVISFLETIASDGVVIVNNLDAPASLNIDHVGEPMVALTNRLVGKLYQHPRRRTAHGVMREKTPVASHLSDYDLANPLSMHTDHAFIENVPGFMQFMFQAQGSVHTRVCDGFAVAEELRRTEPDAFRILSSVPFTHSLRTVHYDERGDYCDRGSLHDGVFEDCHTHPIIELDADGVIRRVAHSEIKRGVCALSFDDFLPAMEAYSKWMRLIEDQVCVHACVHSRRAALFCLFVCMTPSVRV